MSPFGPLTTMATKQPAATLLNALDNAQAQEPPLPTKKPQNCPHGSGTKKKSGKFHETTSSAFLGPGTYCSVAFCSIVAL